jgi:protein-L-isoaspartate O-methyltransferase
MDGLDDLAERDVIIITDTDPSAETELRTRLRPRGYMMALIGKDGRVALRKPSPWSVRELSRSIDKMPLRQQEISDRRVSEQ